MKKSIYRTLAEAIVFGGLVNFQVSTDRVDVRKLTVDEIKDYIKEESADAKKAEEAEVLAGEKKEIGWGSQVRSYVLHPYRMVKDHRTNYEVGNTDAVLDGDLDGFIEAYLLSKS